MPKEKLSIKDYLVKPVQRLMKYQLLLITAKKYSEKASVSNAIVIKVRLLRGIWPSRKSFVPLVKDIQDT